MKPKGRRERAEGATEHTNTLRLSRAAWSQQRNQLTTQNKPIYRKTVKLILLPLKTSIKLNKSGFLLIDFNLYFFKYRRSS